MKMHNDPHSWSDLLKLLQSWWRGDTPLDAVVMPIAVAGLRIAHFGSGGGWKRRTLEILLCGALTLTFTFALKYVEWSKPLSVTIGGGVGLIGVDAICEAAVRVIGNKFSGSRGQLIQVLNSQRRASLDMVAWSEGTDNGRQPARNHGYDVIVGGELFTDYSDHPHKLITLNPKLKSIAAGHYQLLLRRWDAYRKQFGLKDFSPRSQDSTALQQIEERGALPMVDRGNTRQAIDRCNNIWASLPGTGCGQYEHRVGDLISRFKEAGGAVNEAEL